MKNKEDNKNGEYTVTDDNFNYFTSEACNDDTIKDDYFDKDLSHKMVNTDENELNKNVNSDKKDLGEIGFEEFQNYFSELNSDKNNLKNAFLEGFAFLDRNK